MGFFFDEAWNGENGGDAGFPVMATDSLIMPDTTPSYTGTFASDGLLGAFDKLGATGIKIASSYADFTKAMSTIDLNKKMAEIQGSVTIAQGQNQLRAAQSQFPGMQTLQQMQSRMSGTDTIMVVAAVIGIGLGILQFAKR